jgi:hypothetical protein
VAPDLLLLLLLAAQRPLPCDTNNILHRECIEMGSGEQHLPLAEVLAALCLLDWLLDNFRYV